MNGRCHNDPMDFAEDVCDSCGEQFCGPCLVFPRGSKGAPYCTHCAMARSGVRNRRTVKPRSRSEIRKRRKELRAHLAAQDGPQKLELPGTDLINGPGLEPWGDEETGSEEAPRPSKRPGLVSRFRRRTDDPPATDPDPPAPPARDEPDDAPIDDELAAADSITEVEDADSSAERSSAAALLEQLREHDPEGDDGVWLPPVRETPAPPAWTLPDIEQAPLGAGGPWGALASPAAEETSDATGATDSLDPSPPVFVSEAELRSQGPADKDEAGNWVPPSLRGIAPSAHEAAGALPRRRRRQAGDS